MLRLRLVSSFRSSLGIFDCLLFSSCVVDDRLHVHKDLSKISLEFLYELIFVVVAAELELCSSLKHFNLLWMFGQGLLSSDIVWHQISEPGCFTLNA